MPKIQLYESTKSVKKESQMLQTKKSVKKWKWKQLKKAKEKPIEIVKIDKKIGFFTVQSTKAENIDKEKVWA